LSETPIQRDAESGGGGAETAMLVIRLVLGGLLALCGFLTLLNTRGLLASLEAARLPGFAADGAWAASLAGQLPWWEIALAALLILGIAPRGSALVSALLLGAFAALGAPLLYWGLDTGCRCLGPLSGAVGALKAAIDGAGALLLLGVALRRTHRWTVPRMFSALAAEGALGVESIPEVADRG
jgi:uncharacterized membrane protein YphA (DoxX/SURF4 family)